MTFYDKYLRGVKWAQLIGYEYVIVQAACLFLASYKIPQTAVIAACALLGVAVAYVYLVIPKGPDMILEVLAKTTLSSRVPSWAVVPVETPTAPVTPAEGAVAVLVQPPVAPLPPVPPVPIVPPDSTVSNPLLASPVPPV